ncbi:MAG: hypothetical protein KC591_12175, partial [Gemmatimonadetes bacterium]|nr:hypothetical protein [Gemmatimonadota bacterium]
RLGLGTNRWGPGDTGTLLLSDAAFPYPEIAWARTFGERFRFVSTTAALHLPEQRWFSGHRIEVAFGSRLRVGVAECAAYRSSAPDLLYVMGLIPYTLVQRLHDRTSTPGTPVTPHRNNIAIAGDFAWRPGHGLRLDGQLLIDDFATESASQPDRIGWLAGLGWSGWVAGGATSARAEMAKVYRWTYAVFYDANLIQDGVPLGYGDGPDVERGRVTVDRDVSPDLRVGVGVDWRRRGASPVGEFWDPDTAETRSAGATLTDPVERRVFPHVRVESLWRDALRSVVRIGALDLQNEANVAGADRRGFAADVSLRARW